MPLVESRKRNCWPELPDGNGLNLAKQLKLRPETKTIPIIFVTASKDSKLRESAMMMGIAGLVEKPYDLEELLGTVRLSLHEIGKSSRYLATFATGTQSKRVVIHHHDGCGRLHALTS